MKHARNTHANGPRRIPVASPNRISVIQARSSSHRPLPESLHARRRRAAGGHRQRAWSNVVLAVHAQSALRIGPEWSVLGPHDIGNRWSSAGTSGHARDARIAVHAACTVPTSPGEAAWGRVQSPTRLPWPSGLLPTRRWSPRTGLTRWPSWEPSPPGASDVVLTGRATHVPPAA
jgi:hypothetical protein